jgi:hypothetical protein
MGKIVIWVSDDTAHGIQAHADMYPRMLITSTVPALHSWNIKTDDMEFTYHAEKETDHA